VAVSDAIPRPKCGIWFVSSIDVTEVVTAELSHGPEGRKTILFFFFFFFSSFGEPGLSHFLHAPLEIRE